MKHEESWKNWADRHLDLLEHRNLKRTTRDSFDCPPPLSFATNDYLGLSAHESIVAEAQRVWQLMGSGPRASALICGRTEYHAALEQDLARLKSSEAALLFSSGYAANVGLLSALADVDFTIFSDALNHASLIDGCRLAKQMGADVVVYDHLDLDDLAQKLRACGTPRRLVVSDSLFSMSGEFVDTAALLELCRDCHAALCLDEAHANLVFGKHGGGISELQGTAGDIHFQTGTLSKAFGLQGGFVTTSHTMKELLFNRARSQVFSTALAAPIAAAARAAVKLGHEDAAPRQALQSNLALAARLLNRPCRSPIVPLPMPSPEAALATSRALQSQGFHVPAIRPPTVPRGEALLRLSLSAAHTPGDIEDLVHTLKPLLPDIRGSKLP